MKRLFVLLLTLCFLVPQVFAESNFSTLDLQNATDEELEDLRLAVIAEQRSRLKTKIIFSQDDITIGKGTTLTIKAEVTDIPEGQKAGKMTWNTSDKSIATVNNGNIRGVNEGKANISCATILTDGTEISAYIEVNVIIPIKSISFKTKTEKVNVGSNYHQEINIQPNNASNKTIQYDTSDPNIAKVNEEGIVSLIGTGTVTITATTVDGSNKRASYNIVSQSPPGVEIIKFSNAPAQYEKEIRFQDLAWDKSDNYVVNQLSQKRLIPKYYFSGSGYRGCFCWPENDKDLFDKNISSRLLPEIIKENKYVGIWNTQHDALKTIGGHDAYAIFTHFVGNINAKGAISNTCDRLKAVTISYRQKINETPDMNMFIDLLSKLTDQYGEFDLYINSNLDKNSRNYNFETKKYTDGISHKELIEKAKDLAASISLLDTKGIYAFACIHGQKDTGIVLRWIDSNEIELTYCKTDVRLYFEKMKEALEKTTVKTENTGL